jgi:hypothetical protein
MLVFATASAPGLLGGQGVQSGGMRLPVYITNPAKPGSTPVPISRRSGAV